MTSLPIYYKDSRGRGEAMPERQTPWERNQVFHRKGIVVFFLAVIAGCVWLTGRLAYLMIFQSEYYMAQADELHERERAIKAARGEIYDANGTVIAANRTVCTISVVHNQVTDPERVVEILAQELAMDPERVRASVEKYTSREVVIVRILPSIPFNIDSYFTSSPIIPWLSLPVKPSTREAKFPKG